MSHAGQRRLAREFALRLLYARDLQTAVGIESAPTQRPNWWRLEDKLSITPPTEQFARELAKGVREHQPEIDAAISAAAQRWRVDRMGPVERNILRLGVYELQFAQDAPVSVVIDEAIELAKCYGDAESDRFVNGILDAVANGPREA
ncbi:MAG: transcription antitermination factor NusB [Candidatus Hinthialibacter antarcticus]|nr:transcription antitermination factor NusB [Candidatus Hinthialibacter antarcticus]